MQAGGRSGPGTALRPIGTAARTFRRIRDLCRPGRVAPAGAGRILCASMRALLVAAVLLGGAPSLAGCLAEPAPRDWLAVGFRTPEQTFRTFQTALRADQPDLEYRCLSSDFKERQQGLTETWYRHYREELFREQPWLKLAAKAKILRTLRLAPDRMRIEAEVDTWFHDERFAIDFVRQDYYELWIDGKCVQDDALPWASFARESEDELIVRVPLDAPLERHASRELCAGHEWKIDDFPLTDVAP